MLADVVPFLACPHCGRSLSLAGAALRCGRGHAFDVARQGYVSLPGRNARAGPADTASMVAARERFLAAGHYRPLAAAVAEAAERATAGRSPGCVVDLGAGTGYYLAAVLDRLPGQVGVALDISRYALRRAARAHVRAGAVGCDVWAGLPLRPSAAALVINVFAPRNGPEIGRVLRPGGSLVVASPTGRHLAELVDALGLLSVDERKQDRLAAALHGHLEPEWQTMHEAPMSLGHDDVLALAMMGPSAWHADAAAMRAAVRRLPDPITVSVSVTVSVFRRR